MRYDVFVSCGEWATVSRCMCVYMLIFFLRVSIMLNCDRSRSVTTRLNYKVRTRMYLFTLGSKSTSMHMPECRKLRRVRTENCYLSAGLESKPVRMPFPAPVNSTKARYLISTRR